MNELDCYTRSWGATAVPFGPLSETQWVAIPSQQRAFTLLDQTAALRGVMLLSGGNGMGKSTLVGRWVRQLDSRLYTPVNLTQATLSSSGLLASLARALGKRASMRRERNLDELSSYLSEHERQTLVIVMDDAQNSTHGTLEELRLLLGLNLPSQPTFALILIGDEYLLGQLQLRNHRALCSRLSAHHLLSPWTLEEIQTYLTKPGWKPWALIAPRSSNRPRWICWCEPRRACRAASAFWLGRPGWKPPGPRLREINAQTMQLAMEQVPGLDRPDSPQLMIERIQQAHALYCRLTGQRVSLRFDRERLWYELFQAGFNEADLQRVIRYLQREIREGRRNVGALKLSNLLQFDRFEEDLNISRVQLYAPKPSNPARPPAAPASPHEDEEARQRAFQILARFRAEQGW